MITTQATSINPTEQSQAAGQGGPPQGKVDPMLLAFYYLMEASNETNRNAILHAKELNQNARAQELLNNRAAQLQWAYVPKKDIKHYSKKIVSTHWRWTFWKGFTYQTTRIYRWTVCKNQTAVDEAMAKNMRVNGERQLIEEQMAVLGQLANVGEQGVLNMTSMATRTQGEASNILDILANLTYKALLTRKPQS